MWNVRAFLSRTLYRLNHSLPLAQIVQHFFYILFSYTLWLVRFPYRTIIAQGHLSLEGYFEL